MPPPTINKRKSLKELQSEEAKKDVRPNTIIVTGLPGAGKTSLAASLFDPGVAKRLALSAEELKGAPTITLKGAIWIEADEQGLVALTAKKIQPEYVLSLTTLANAHNGRLSPALRDLHAYIGEAKEVGVHTFVVDTVTSFGGQWLVREFVDGSDNGYAGWGTVLREQTKLMAIGHTLGLRQIWLAQPAENKLEELAQSTKGTELDKAKAHAQAVAGGKNYIIPAISGHGFRRVMNAQCSMSSWLKSTTVNGKRQRVLYPFGGDGSQGKTRYEGILERKETADLYAIDQKILAAVGKAKV